MKWELMDDGWGSKHITFHSVIWGAQLINEGGSQKKPFTPLHSSTNSIKIILIFICLIHSAVNEEKKLKLYYNSKLVREDL